MSLYREYLDLLERHKMDVDLVGNLKKIYCNTENRISKYEYSDENRMIHDRVKEYIGKFDGDKMMEVGRVLDSIWYYDTNNRDYGYGVKTETYYKLSTNDNVYEISFESNNVDEIYEMRINRYIIIDDNNINVHKVGAIYNELELKYISKEEFLLILVLIHNGDKLVKKLLANIDENNVIINKQIN